MTAAHPPRQEHDQSNTTSRRNRFPAGQRGGTQPLAAASRIGLLGGLPSDTSQALITLQTFADHNVQVIVQLGDMDIRRPTRSGEVFLRYLSTLLIRHGQIPYFLDGEHDARTQINTYPLSRSGYRIPAANIASPGHTQTIQMHPNRRKHLHDRP